MKPVSSEGISSELGLIHQRAVPENDLTLENGIQYVPPATHATTYDGYGHLLTDGRWTYVWDGENRLTQIGTAVGVFWAGQDKVEVEVYLRQTLPAHPQAGPQTTFRERDLQ